MPDGTAGWRAGQGVTYIAFSSTVARSWPRVLAGTESAADAVLGDWGQLTDDAVVDDVAIVIGVHDDEMVAVYEPESWRRVDQGRVRFSGKPSQAWSHLVGAPNPGWSFSRRGVARSVQPIPLATFSEGTAPVEPVGPGIRRAIVQGFVLTVGPESATLHVPRGRVVTVEVA